MPGTHERGSSCGSTMSNSFMEEGEIELREIQKLEGHTDRVWCVAWNPATGGTTGVPAVFASCSGDKTVRIWEQTSLSSFSSFQCKAVLDETTHTRTVRSCAWSPSGKRLATGSFDATAAVWEKIDGDYECVFIVEGHDSEIKSVSWNASGAYLATCSRDRSVWIWQEQAGYEYELMAVMPDHTQDVKMVVWHPQMVVLFSCGYDNTIRIYGDDFDDDWQCVQTLKASDNGHTSTVWALSFNADGDKMVSCSDDLTMKVWETDSFEFGDTFEPWRHLCTLSGYHDRTIFSVHWSSDDIIATGAADNGIRLFAENKDGSLDGPAYKQIFKKENAHETDVNCVQWCPTQSGVLLSASDDGTIKVWELAG